jgi:hypothetical protein
VSTFGNTADIYAIVHLVSHACQHITADQRHSGGDTVAKILEISGEWRHKDDFLYKPPEKSHGVKSGYRGGHRINASSSQFLRLILDVPVEELCTDSLHLGISHTTSWDCWKEVLPSGILLEIVAAHSQRTRFLNIQKHKMTAQVYWTPYLLLLSPSGKSVQLCSPTFP